MAFYTALGGNRFASNGYTRGPWDAAAQHAGPPAALLGRAVEATARPGMRVARLTVDIARPACGPYRRGTAGLVRTQDGPAPDIGPDPTVRLDEAEGRPFFPVPWDVGYHTAMEVRFAAGSFLSRGPATAWLRMRVPLVEG